MKKLLLASLIVSYGVAASTPKPIVSVQVAKMKKVAKSLMFPALVKSRVESNIQADADLIVVKQLVSLGQKVKKGDRLLELRNQDTSVDYRNRIILAQVSGTVADILVSQGQYIMKGRDLIKINDPEKLYLKLEVPVGNYQDMKSGLKARGKTAMINGQTFEAMISGIGTVTDPMSGTIPVELTFSGDIKAFLPGTITNIELMLSEQDKLMVPENAIYYAADKTYIPVLKEGKVSKVEIKVGSRARGEIEILEGVKLGETMVVGAGEFLKDGSIVEVAKE